MKKIRRYLVVVTVFIFADFEQAFARNRSGLQTRKHLQVQC